ncbi:PTS sugar transporter subunit IIA [Aquibacillus rhizosphaerae]|uniref:PTS glucose transporter subunit IIA n=1 Tax=Aquibacillus rhizosphaerae TaxID=3051431 RepID=A0ABT7L9X5_9BACI|nr:PTS glucose transporter subunit IIA [Aquibacillus sp. LR5S19]MDL4842657.1 PTS glucose transporter subunit IIA [Aquibacillus sp. LR5S19]
MLKNLFGQKDTHEVLLAPLSGKVMDMEEVPDPTFSKKMMGDGIAILPTEGKVVSPIKGKVIQVFPTKHAIGLESKNGVEILIHIGLETVALNGEHFETHVKVGQTVKPGDLLVSFELVEVEKKAESIISPIVVTNGEKVSELDKQTGSDVIAGESEVIRYRLN